MISYGQHFASFIIEALNFTKFLGNYILRYKCNVYSYSSLQLKAEFADRLGLGQDWDIMNTIKTEGLVQEELAIGTPLPTPDYKTRVFGDMVRLCWL